MGEKKGGMRLCKDVQLLCKTQAQMFTVDKGDTNER